MIVCSLHPSYGRPQMLIPGESYCLLYCCCHLASFEPKGNSKCTNGKLRRVPVKSDCFLKHHIFCAATLKWHTHAPLRRAQDAATFWHIIPDLRVRYKEFF